jgi:hypothetical protein
MLRKNKGNRVNPVAHDALTPALRGRGRRAPAWVRTLDGLGLGTPGVFRILRTGNVTGWDLFEARGVNPPSGIFQRINWSGILW